MSDIRLVVDAACDLSIEQAADAGIVLCGAGIHINGKEYKETIEITKDRFYEEFAKCKELPVTSHVSPYTFQQVYSSALNDGVRDVIHVTIHSGGSGTLGAAMLAAKTFYEENPAATERMKIHHVDSNTYSIGYGYPTLRAAYMAREGADAHTILKYLNDWFDRVDVYFTVFSLDVVRRSGRVSAAAALAGDLLGLKPVIQMTEGTSIIVEKTRGARKALQYLTDILTKGIEPGGEYFILKGELDEPANLIAESLEAAVGYPPTDILRVGPSIVINSGPKLVGLVFRGKPRGHRG
ncbi:MAG: DegV family protein [Oscillospiraceae bacterium]|jgi:DegV family protein with EDD domain|nr:DegV family protein [Oscillospiraceae bacterium]